MYPTEEQWLGLFKDTYWEEWTSYDEEDGVQSTTYHRRLLVKGKPVVSRDGHEMYTDGEFYIWRNQMWAGKLRNLDEPTENFPTWLKYKPWN